MEGIHFKGAIMQVVISLFRSRNFSTAKMLREGNAWNQKGSHRTSLEFIPSIWNTLCICIHRCFYPNIAFYKKKIIIKNLGFVIKWSIQFPIANCHKIDCLTRTASLNSLCFCLFLLWFHEKLLLDLLLNTKKHIALKCEAIADRIKLVKKFFISIYLL